MIQRDSFGYHSSQQQQQQQQQQMQQLSTSSSSSSSSSSSTIYDCNGINEETSVVMNDGFQNYIDTTSSYLCSGSSETIISDTKQVLTTTISSTVSSSSSTTSSTSTSLFLPPPPPPPPLQTKTTTRKSCNSLGGGDVSQILRFNRNQLTKTKTKVRTADGRIYEEQISTLSCEFKGIDETTGVHKRYDTITTISPFIYCKLLNSWIVYNNNNNQNNQINQNNKKITIITINVWFDQFLWKERAIEMFKEFKGILPTVICMQEVTPVFLLFLKDQDWVQDHYIISDCGQSDTVFPYGVIMMIKKQQSGGILSLNSFTIYPLESNQNRKMLMACLNNQSTGGTPLTISTVHLESLDKSKQERLNQLKYIESIFKQQQQQQLKNSNQNNEIMMESYLIGDFNFGKDTIENKEIIEQRFIDLWDLVNNENSNGITCIKKNERVDRIVVWKGEDPQSHRLYNQLQGNTWKMELICTKPIDICPARRRCEMMSLEEQVYPSDHYGVQLM